MAREEVIMQLDNVSRTFMMGEVTVHALKESSLDIFKGELLVILGPSGSGKSTLLNLVGGMDRPTTGRISFKNTELTGASDRALTNFRRNSVGFVFQFFNLISDLTALENVALAAELVADALPVEKALRDVGLDDRLNHFPAQLSGGEQQRVSIARAIVKQPSLVLCDEPTGALDYTTGKVVLKLLDDISHKQGRTVIIVTHNTPIAGMADRVIRMRSGRIIEITENENPLSPERVEW